MTSICNLPDDVLRTLADHLGVDGGWRSLDEVACDQAALAMCARALRPLADALAHDLRSALGLTGDAGFLERTRPTVPCTLECSVSDTSSMADLRSAAAMCGVPGARSRAETLERVRDAVSRRSELVQRRESQIKRFDASESYPPVPCNPVPQSMRERVKEEQRLTATSARQSFALTTNDLHRLPARLKCNPIFKSAAPMRLYRVCDLRDASLAKHGGREGLASYREKSSRRSDRMVRAAAEAREKRYAKLERALAARGCEVRTDSRLCATYLATGHGDVDEIADVMAEMHFCFEHTRYSEILDENISAWREMGERYDFHEESHIARRNAIEEFMADGGNMNLVPAHLR